MKGDSPFDQEEEIAQLAGMKGKSPFDQEEEKEKASTQNEQPEPSNDFWVERFCRCVP